jgi:EAL domain-containing protein (putative c-di-GMP-specific phosphodiesterase class I)
LEDVNLVLDLPAAVSRGEIVVFFQPQIDIASGRLVAVEGLSRWRHPIYGLIPPLDYIPEAENTGAIHGLGAFMISDSCRCAARWAESGMPIEVAVNVSAVQLGYPSFFDDVLRTLETTPLSPRLLTVEVTESQAILNLDVAIHGLELLERAGVGVSIDDFGTGFSSLVQVKSLPSTELKIDRSLTQSEAHDSATTIASIVETAHELGVRVVAEGIETEEQYNRVRRAGCDRAQGFLLGKPIPESEMDALLVSLAG